MNLKANIKYQLKLISNHQVQTEWQKHVIRIKNLAKLTHNSLDQYSYSCL